MSLTELLRARFGDVIADDEVSDLETSPTLSVILSHRTHRTFRDEPVPRELIHLVLACTFSAPSKSDLQQASVIYVQDRHRRDAIAELIPSMPWIGTCPEFFLFVADGRRIKRIAEFREKPFANDNLDNFLAAVCDVGLVMGNFIIAAQALGLGCCPISVVRDHIDEIAAIVELPERVIPVAGMCLGYPAREGFVSMRLPMSVTVHQDRYDDSDLEDLIDDYDRRRDARFSLVPDRQKHKTQYGVAEFYGWSEDKARQMSHPERSEVGNFVRRSDFGLS